MASYCTVAQMIGLFGREELLELSNLYDPQAEEIDTAKVQAAIDYAEAEVNTYLGKWYDLAAISALEPAQIPVVLINKVADIARYQLDSLRARDDVRKRYEDAIQWLKLIAKGDVDLGLPKAENGATTPTGGAPDYFAGDRVFTPDTLRGY